MKTLALLLTFLICAFGVHAQTESYLQDGANTIHVTHYGEGDPILIINGGPGMHSEGFRSLAELLAQFGKAIIYDQRGTGTSKLPRTDSETIRIDSMVHDIEVIREHFEAETWVVMGHSFGGMLGSYYASRHPERIRGLILSSSGGVNMGLFSRLDIRGRLSRSQQDSLQYWEARIDAGDHSHAARLKRGFFLAPAYLHKKEFVPIVAERLTQGDLHVNGLVYGDMRRIGFDCANELGQLRVPVLIMQGKNDIIDLHTARQTMMAFRETEFVLLPDCGHYGWLEQPEQYFQRIKNYLQKLEG